MQTLCSTVGSLAEKWCYNLQLTGPVAQLVEQRIENPRVDGSIPSQATKIKRPTVLSWAFSFSRPQVGAGSGAILRVPCPSCIRAGNAPRISYSALSSHKTSANTDEVAHAERLMWQ